MRICGSIADIDQQQWNLLVVTANCGVLHPALRHEFLLALESQGSVTPETGWSPLHLALEDEGELVACMPLYLKTHSYGEYVFDWAWAQAYQRAGFDYFPKLLSAIPFTPVLAPKLLAKTPAAAKALADGLLQLASKVSQDPSLLGTKVSSAHLLFTEALDQQALKQTCLIRKSVQFHWQNQNPPNQNTFEDFEDFLSTLSKKRRKNIRSERKKVAEAGVSIKRFTGLDIAPTTLDYFYHCYAKTYAEHHSSPYLSKGFFDELIRTMPESLMLAVAYQHNQPVAASFFLHSQARLYGRYWGCTSDISCLHFEMCYYQGIEFAIEQSIQYFEGGAQGEHKMARGLNPTTLTSMHWIADSRFEDAIARYLDRETSQLGMYVDELQEHTAFKQTQLDFNRLA